MINPDSMVKWQLAIYDSAKENGIEILDPEGIQILFPSYNRDGALENQFTLILKIKIKETK